MLATVVDISRSSAYRNNHYSRDQNDLNIVVMLMSSMKLLTNREPPSFFLPQRLSKRACHEYRTDEIVVPCRRRVFFNRPELTVQMIRVCLPGISFDTPMKVTFVSMSRSVPPKSIVMMQSSS